jgi:hypothetical protein
MIPKMMQNLREINSLGIQVWDIKPDMYLGGVILNLSQAGLFLITNLISNREYGIEAMS